MVLSGEFSFITFMIPQVNFVSIFTFCEISTPYLLIRYTNYESPKAREISENPRGTLVFYWGALFRQVSHIFPLYTRCCRSKFIGIFSQLSLSYGVSWISYQNSKYGSVKHEAQGTNICDEYSLVSSIPKPSFLHAEPPKLSCRWNQSLTITWCTCNPTRNQPSK